MGRRQVRDGRKRKEGEKYSSDNGGMGFVD